MLFPVLLFGAVVSVQKGAIVVRGRSYEAVLSGEDGSLLCLKTKRGPLAELSGRDGLWRLAFRDGTGLSASQFSPGGRRRFSWRRTEGGLALTYEAPEATVRVLVSAGEDSLDFSFEVERPRADVLRVAFPPNLRLDPGGLEAAYFPADLGLKLKRSFFAPQRPGEAGWEPVRVGPEAWVRLVGVPCEMRPNDDPPVPVRVTAEGREWLGEPLARELEGRRFVVNRPPEGGKCDIALVTSKNGPFILGHRIGKGWVFRVGGPVRGEQASLILRAMARAARAAWERMGGPKGKAGVILLHRGPKTGGWTDVGTERWLGALWRAFRGTGVRIGRIEGVDELLKALRGGDFLLVLNPYGEWLPARSVEGWGETVEAIKGFVKGGGVWVETGGYPMYYALVPRRFLSLSGHYPPAFCDFVHFETEAGTLSVYGIQPDIEGHIFVPADLRLWADEDGAHFGREFVTFVKAGGKWASPVVRLQVGLSAVEALSEYGKENLFVKGLDEKVPHDVLERWKRSVLVKYTGGTFRDQMEGLRFIPSPAVIHLVDYLRGGFDKQYPDHLPPNPSKGTPEEFRRLIDEAHKLGHLVMPYTNPTWWCDDPKGPTFLKWGTEPLLRKLDGGLRKERYGPKWGWSICPWHRAVLEATDTIRRQFTEEYPVDIIFQDQIGARSWAYDLNPASPTPYAYTQGMIELAKRTAKFRPVSTENGFDRLINVEAQFCGITWRIVPTEFAPPWRRLFSEWLPRRCFEVFPLALFLAHDKVIFTHHDLGQQVTNDLTLSWTLLLGFELIYAIPPGALRRPKEREWLKWLAVLQREVCSLYIGEPLLDFRYLSGSGDRAVVSSKFGGVRVVANLRDEPFELPGGVVIAPRGFYARADGKEAGIVARWRGADYSGEPLRFILSGRKLWLYIPEGREFLLPVRIKRASAEGLAVEVRRRPEGSIVKLPLPGRKRIPAGLAGIPPAKRGRPPRFVAVLCFKPDSPELYGWTKVKAEEWMEFLKRSDFVKGCGLEVVPISDFKALFEALSRPGEFFAVLNPYGEKFPAPSGREWGRVVEAVGRYVEGGGVWWEVAGHPFYYAVVPYKGRWRTTPVGPAGFGLLGGSCRMLADEEPPCPVRPTRVGREWLGERWARSVEGREAVVNRPPADGRWSVALLGSENGPYVVGYQLGGFGWLFRVCGPLDGLDVVGPTVAGVLRHLYESPPAVLPPVKPAFRLVECEVAR